MLSVSFSIFNVSVMPTMIETARLILRKMTLDDAPFFFKLNSNPNVVKYTGDGAFKNIKEAENITNYVISQYTKHGYGRLLVIEKNTLLPIGWCGLKYHEDLRDTDIGYRFLEEKWGCGYATESAAACIKYGFDQLQLKRIIGRAAIDNVASINVFKKLNMIYEKTEHFPEHDAVVYEIKKENYYL